nr:hypothetical protein [Myxacorys almedinensis]
MWNELSWRRKPHIEQTTVCVWENDEKLWLYRVEDAVLMVEVKPVSDAEVDAIGQVVLKRLMTADQAIDMLNKTGGET